MGVTEAEAAYLHAVQLQQDALASALRAFAKWFATEWQQTREQWEKETAEPAPSPDWFAGRAEGVRSAEDAVEFFIGEVGI
jgi:uncharacterized damage-inducible protein DinB